MVALQAPQVQEPRTANRVVRAATTGPASILLVAPIPLEETANPVER